MGKYWNCSFCSENDIIRSQAYTIMLLHADCIPQYFILQRRLLWRHLWRHRVIWAYHSFSSITHDQSELVSRKRYQCANNDPPSQMTCNTTSLVQRPDLTRTVLTLTSDQHTPWSFLNKKYRHSLTRQIRWHQNCCSAIVFVFLQSGTPLVRFYVQIMLSIMWRDLHRVQLPGRIVTC